MAKEKSCGKAACLAVRDELKLTQYTVDEYRQESANMNAWLEALVDTGLSETARHCVAFTVRHHLEHVRKCRKGSCAPAASKLDPVALRREEGR